MSLVLADFVDIPNSQHLEPFSDPAISHLRYRDIPTSSAPCCWQLNNQIPTFSDAARRLTASERAREQEE